VKKMKALFRKIKEILRQLTGKDLLVPSWFLKKRKRNLKKSGK